MVHALHPRTDMTLQEESAIALAEQGQRAHTLSFSEPELRALQAVAAAWAKAMKDHPDATRLYLDADQIDPALRALAKITQAR
jgi:hypothetical protein